MGTFITVLAAVLLAVVLGLVLSKQSKDMSLLLTMATCAMVMIAAAVYLQPVLDFVRRLQSVGNLDSDILQIMLKSVGIALVGEIAGMICNDSGFAAMGKAIRILSTAAILWLSLPLMESLLELLQKIMGET